MCCAARWCAAVRAAMYDEGSRMGVVRKTFDKNELIIRTELGKVRLGRSA